MIIVRGKANDPKDAYPATEGQLLCLLPLEKAPYVLLTAFYAFNMQYTAGCTNFYSFLEYLFLDVPAPKRSKIQHFITTLFNICFKLNLTVLYIIVKLF